MYLLHTLASKGHYIDSNGTRYDVHIAQNPYPVSAWEVYDSLEEALKAWGITEIPDVPLYDAKEETINLIQKWVDTSVVAKKEITCEALGENIVFDRQALINAMGVKPGMYWIGVSNVPHELTEELITGIQTALQNYVQSIYAMATDWRSMVASAETVEEVETIAKQILELWPTGEVVPELSFSSSTSEGEVVEAGSDATEKEGE